MQRPAEGEKQRAKIRLKNTPAELFWRCDAMSGLSERNERNAENARVHARVSNGRRPLKDALLERCSKDAPLVKTKRAYKGIHINNFK
ncbi:hypothetical protein NDU88_001340 [Pleurodeles waltl]|uniref:Uncharacterized protein n=1 Tax=Pleurodeles waltl TaxID=8319 RepID=A0AAV7U628_PLEWA|nr:hypothetical protein NDU88_001340 [Pleurodeles waltl]